MNKSVALLLAALLAVGAYVAAGPWITVHAIRDAIEANDSAALSERVDFPALRSSLKRQLADRLIRAAGPELQSNALAALGIGIATGASSMAVDATVNPLGLAALMQGRAIWRQVGDDFVPPDPAVPAQRPFQDARYQYESPSRFTATVHGEDGRPLVFILTRQGLHWRLTDIRLAR
jgi:Protein of unknown function (DUF2939).